MSKPERDSLRSFLFENLDIRGEIVHLDRSWQEALKSHDYPPAIQQLLGEMMAASVLLIGTLKFQGRLTLQIKGQGPIRLGVVECTSDRALRGLIHWQGELEEHSRFADLIGKGIMAITLEQGRSGERYQGIVDANGDSLSEVLEHYLHYSEQLDTRLWLTADANNAAGMLLQRLPEKNETEDIDAWPRVTQLAETITSDELRMLDARKILHRLFHEEDVRLFDAEPVCFRCACSRDRVQNTLRMLGVDEVRAVVVEQGAVNVDCEFCNQHYVFDAVDVEALFAAEVVLDAPKRHQ